MLEAIDLTIKEVKLIVISSRNWEDVSNFGAQVAIPFRSDINTREVFHVKNVRIMTFAFPYFVR